VEWFDTVESTMDVAAAAAADGASAGRIVIANQQTAGRGRRGHTWSSPPGAGLYFSCLARPTRHLDVITLAAGVGVRDGIAAATGLRAELKWPNDLLIGSRKLAGLLAEGHHLATPAAAVVIGVGVNLGPAAYPPDVASRATDLQTEAGRELSRFGVFAAVLEHLADALQTLEAGDAGGILRRWRDASPLAVGAAVRWLKDGVEMQGVTEGIDDSGALLVRTSSALERVVAGELHWQLNPHS
jgi:BirA family biotin operon repressor/biotin-[acetyl-CoA-carboxylase] ligase